MKIIADREKCQGHARCYAVSPELFDLDEAGYTAITEKEVPAGAEDAARKGARACPERAIMIEE